MISQYTFANVIGRFIAHLTMQSTIVSIATLFAVCEALEHEPDAESHRQKLSHEEYLSLFRLLEEGNNHFLVGRIYLARERYGEAVATIAKTVPSDHWLYREARVGYDELRRYCAWDEPRQFQVYALLTHLRSAIRERRNGHRKQALVEVAKALQAVDKLEVTENYVSILVLKCRAYCEDFYGEAALVPTLEKLVLQCRDVYGAENPSTIPERAHLAALMADSSKGWRIGSRSV